MNDEEYNKKISLKFELEELGFINISESLYKKRISSSFANSRKVETDICIHMYQSSAEENEMTLNADYLDIDNSFLLNGIFVKQKTRILKFIDFFQAVLNFRSQGIIIECGTQQLTTIADKFVLVRTVNFFDLIKFSSNKYSFQPCELELKEELVSCFRELAKENYFSPNITFSYIKMTEDNKYMYAYP